MKKPIIIILLGLALSAPGQSITNINIGVDSNSNAWAKVNANNGTLATWHSAQSLSNAWYQSQIAGLAGSSGSQPQYFTNALNGATNRLVQPMTSTPSDVQGWLLCIHTDATSGYAPGDRVAVAAVNAVAGIVAGAYNQWQNGIGYAWNATNLVITTGTATPFNASTAWVMPGKNGGESNVSAITNFVLVTRVEP